MMRLMVLIVVLLDMSGSMALGSRIEALNSTMRTLLALMRSADPIQEQPVPIWTAIAAFTHEPLWIVDEPTPASEVVWADLRPRPRERGDIARAVANAERFIATEVPSRFDEALLVVITDSPAASAAAQSESPSQSRIERRTLIVDAPAANPHGNVSPADVLELARSLVT